MNVTIASAAWTAIVEHAATVAPHEACGILLGRSGTIDAAVAARNVATAPDRAFEIDPAALVRVHREARGSGREVIGCYHSHPDGAGAPSPADAAGAIENGRIWVIAAGGDLTAWRATPHGLRHDRFDPLDLVVA